MKISRRLTKVRAIAGVTLLGVLGGILLTTLTAFLGMKPAQVHAQATSFAWVNAGTVTLNGVAYFDRNVAGSGVTDTGYEDHVFINPLAGTCSYAKNNVNNVPKDSIVITEAGKGTHKEFDPNAKDGTQQVTCTTKDTPVSGTNTGASRTFLYRDGDNIVRYDATTLFTKTGNITTNEGGAAQAELFQRVGEQSEPCPDVIVHGLGGGDYKNDWWIFPMVDEDAGVNYGSTAISEKYDHLNVKKDGVTCVVATWELTGDGTQAGRMLLGSTLAGNNPQEAPSSLGLTDVGIPAGFTIQFGDDAFHVDNGIPDKAVAGPPPGSTPPTSNGNGTPDGPKTACDVAADNVGSALWSAISLKWIVCPVINLLMSTVEWLEGFLTTQLITDPSPLQSDTPYHAIWGTLRTISLAIIIIVALVMVIFEAMGIEAFSAYTMRTLFTKFVIAIIFIVFSWPILGEVVNIVNNITDGARTLIYAPFSGQFGNNNLDGGASLMIALLATGGILALGLGGLFSFVLTAVLSIFLTVIVLVVVHAIIYLLIMASPVPIALSVLPNTRKIYEFWKNALLSVFIGLIAVAFAMPALDVIAISTYHLNDGSTLNQIIALIIKFGRVFIVIIIFSKVGGVVAMVAGFADDKSKGVFNRLSNGRSKRVQQNVQDLSTGQRFKGNNVVSKGFNWATGATGAFVNSDNKMGMLGSRAGFQAGMQEHYALAGAAHAKSEKAQIQQHNDSMHRAQTYLTEADARRGLKHDWGMDDAQIETAIAAAKNNGDFGRPQMEYAARQLARTGTGYDDLQQVQDTVSRVAGNNRAMAESLLGSINSDTKGAGRFDLAAGHGAQMKMYDARRHLEQGAKDLQAGRITEAEYHERARAYDHQVQDGYVEAVRGTDAVSMLRSKPIAMRNIGTALTEEIHTQRAIANDSGRNQQERQEAAYKAAQLAGVAESYQQSAIYAAPVNAENLDRGILQPTEQARLDIQSEARQHASTINDQGRVVPVFARDLSGNVIPGPDGRPIPMPNPQYRPSSAEGYNQQTSAAARASALADPNNPLNQR